MADYWLDSDALITAAKSYYALDLAPRFWTFLVEQIRLGTIRASSFVYQELIDFGDPLSEWVKVHKDTLFVGPDQDVQQYVAQIADYVKRTYPDNRSRQFMDGADPWVIAQAKADGGRVVTLETRVNVAAKRPKIPNICAQFNVTPKTTWEMLRELGFSFG